MHDRVELQQILEDILGSGNVYFQPPASVKMAYPAIVYELSDIENEHADNVPYVQRTRYSITVIDKDPDSRIPFAISKLPACSFDRAYKSDNLNHYVLNLYY